MTMAAAGGLLLADVQVEQTTRVTGGSIANIPFVGGKIKEPQVSTTLLKGNRMAMVSKDSTTIYDLDKETVTTVNTAKREYSVMTFAEMREAMDKAMEKMQQMTQQNKAQGEMKWTVKVDPTSERKEVNGFDATKYVLTMDGEATDSKTGKRSGTRMVMDCWVAKSVPGIAEQNAFAKRMAEKLGYGRASGLNPMVQAQMGKGWYEAAAQFQKMDGYTVQSVTRMSTTIDGQPVMVPEGQQNGPQISGGDVAREAGTSAAQSAASRSLGRLGGLGAAGIGGFGRKKKQEEPKPAEASANSGTMVPAVMMEMLMDVNSMSSASVDASKFEVPAGFKQVESELKKMAR
ncbi:hypothetical protein F183_A34640 [Bryobacterales bacterium F-183]|nr:hypothetical protein F183_A34640 [Bryobacterales bacterium F-183]